MVVQPTNKTVAEFFAGIGLMRAGLDRAGWTTTVANEITPLLEFLTNNPVLMLLVFLTSNGVKIEREYCIFMNS